MRCHAHCSFAYSDLACFRKTSFGAIQSPKIIPIKPVAWRSHATEISGTPKRATNARDRRREGHLDLRTRQGHNTQPSFREGLFPVARLNHFASHLAQLSQSDGLIRGPVPTSPHSFLAFFQGRLVSRIVCRCFPTRSRLRPWR